MSPEVKLVLENAMVFMGRNFGHLISNNGHSLGEIVFNTAMTGYQEVLSDPSYCDQIVTMTYPLIGNYGNARDDFEASAPALHALVVKQACQKPSNWRNQRSIDRLLKDYYIPGIEGVDTRKLTKVIRNHGAMKAVIVPKEIDDQQALEILKTPLAKDQVARVSQKQAVHYPGKGKRVVMIDFGFKKSILTSLLQRNCDVIVVPWNTNYQDILRHRPDGIFLSNGPGDPKDILEVLGTVKKLQEQFPTYAICMGHQIFALANGADTQKMKFGHRGANHPVLDMARDRTYITSQNHGYAVTKESLVQTPLELTQVNLNDGSVEGVRHKTLPAVSVQYHPEANPGPDDTAWFFDEFLKAMNSAREVHHA